MFQTDNNTKFKTTKTNNISVLKWTSQSSDCNLRPAKHDSPVPSQGLGQNCEKLEENPKQLDTSHTI